MLIIMDAIYAIFFRKELYYMMVRLHSILILNVHII